MKKSIQSVIIAFVLLLFFLSGCAPAPTPTPIPPTLTSLPTNTLIPPTATIILPTATFETPTPSVIMASNEPIKIGDYSIVLSNVEVKDVGFNPFGLSSNLALQVFVAEETGKIEEVANLKVWFTDDQGNKIEHFIGQSSEGFPTSVQIFAWVAYITQPANGYLLHFPTGEVVDLTPLINK